MLPNIRIERIFLPEDRDCTFTGLKIVCTIVSENKATDELNTSTQPLNYKLNPRYSKTYCGYIKQFFCGEGKKENEKKYEAAYSICVYPYTCVTVIIDTLLTCVS